MSLADADPVLVARAALLAIGLCLAWAAWEAFVAWRRRTAPAGQAAARVKARERGEDSRGWAP